MELIVLYTVHPTSYTKINTPYTIHQTYEVMNEYSYQTLKVYKDAKALAIDVYRLLKLYPAEERYALCDQIRRATYL